VHIESNFRHATQLTFLILRAASVGGQVKLHIIQQNAPLQTQKLPRLFACMRERRLNRQNAHFLFAGRVPSLKFACSDIRERGTQFALPLILGRLRPRFFCLLSGAHATRWLHKVALLFYIKFLARFLGSQPLNRNCIEPLKSLCVQNFIMVSIRAIVQHKS
jgi:hypothetical protein